jgi:hypothetical protein
MQRTTARLDMHTTIMQEMLVEKLDEAFNFTAE